MKTYPLLSGEGLEVRSGQFLKAAAVPTEKAVEMMKLTKKTNRSHDVLRESDMIGETHAIQSDTAL